MSFAVRRMVYRALPASLIGVAGSVLNRPKKSFSLCGEDIVLRHLLLEMIGDRPGFFVDIGAFHPSYTSNTKLLYDAGWRGLNIEADPQKISMFRMFRPRDINVCAVLDATETDREFYFHEGAKYSSMASLDQSTVEHSAASMGRGLSSRTVRTQTIRSILQQHNVTKIDCLNIDIEGSEADILRSEKWASYGTAIIACEIHGQTIEDIMNSAAHNALSEQAYTLAAWTPPTVLYRPRSWDGTRFDDMSDRVW